MGIYIHFIPHHVFIYYLFTCMKQVYKCLLADHRTGEKANHTSPMTADQGSKQKLVIDFFLLTISVGRIVESR